MGCQGGENLIKGMLSGNVAKHGLPGGGGVKSGTSVLPIGRDN